MRGIRSTVGLIINSLKTVFRHPLYTGLALMVAIFIFSSFALLTNISLIVQAIRSNYSLLAITRIMVSLIWGIDISAGHTAAFFMAAVAIMVGMNISLLAFKIARLKGVGYKQGGTSLGGIIGAVLGAGCSACATGFLASLGVAGGLAAFPFKGLELKLASVLILATSQYWLLVSIATCESCTISYPQ